MAHSIEEKQRFGTGEAALLLTVQTGLAIPMAGLAGELRSPEVSIRTKRKAGLRLQKIIAVQAGLALVLRSSAAGLTA